MNKLYRMTTEEFEKRKILYAHDDTKYIVMDGDGVNTYEEYFDRLWNCFNFGEIPHGWKKDFYTENDFLKDILDFFKIIFDARPLVTGAAKMRQYIRGSTTYI